jgi:hypothetical protein
LLIETADLFAGYADAGFVDKLLVDWPTARGRIQRY